MDIKKTSPQFQLEPERDKLDFFHIMKYTSNGYFAHFHRNSELYCIFEGKVKVSINDKTYVLQSGEAVFINSLDFHFYQCDEPAQIGIILIGYRYMRDFRTLFPQNAIPTLLKNVKENQIIFDLLTELNKKENFSEFEKFSYTNLLLHYITKTYGISEKESSHKFLLIDVIQYIYDNFMSPLSLETIAKRFNYNLVYLSHLFAKHIKIDFRTFVSNVRMQHALAMQDDPKYRNKSLTEISEMCGFNSISTFYRAYKRATQQDNNFEIPLHGNATKS